MGEGARRRGLTLRARLASWMVASAVLSLSAFAITAYAVVSFEERADLATDALPETPSEIATETAGEVLTAMAVAAPIALLFSFGGAIWVSRRTLAPVQAVVRTANEMSARDLNRRLEVPTRDPELAELVTALNKLFERLELGFGALERYAADASHELRTPLAVLASELEVALRHERGPDEWKEVAATSLDEVQRLTRLVEALLGLARLDAVPQAEAVDFELREAVDQARIRVEPQAEGAQLTLKIEVAEAEKLTLRGSADALTTALASLLANAVRYTPTGGVVRVSIERAPEGWAEIRVDDSGPGVAEAERESIFEPFGRGSAGRQANDRQDDGKSDGLGLGLALVRRVAEWHGGTITVGASPLGGARFTLRLPMSPS